MPREKGTPATADLGRIFVYDAVARFNERLIGNIDAIDTASMAVLAGNVAVLVFAIDKLAGRQPQGELWAIALVGCQTTARDPHNGNEDISTMRHHTK